MGAGNYYFSPPAGGDWSREINVCLGIPPVHPEERLDDIYSALSLGFARTVQPPRSWSDQIADATVILEVGRMAICQAQHYSGSTIALIVTPEYGLHHWRGKPRGLARG